MLLTPELLIGLAMLAAVVAVYASMPLVLRWAYRSRLNRYRGRH